MIGQCEDELRYCEDSEKLYKRIQLRLKVPLTRRTIQAQRRSFVTGQCVDIPSETVAKIMAKSLGSEGAGI